jgi:muconolactone delta-isomerase
MGMKYLVTMEMEPQVMPRDPQSLAAHVEMVVKQHEAEAELEKANKIVAGGVAAGRTMDVFIVDVASHTELNDIIRGLPLPHAMKVDVVPLADFADGAARERESIDRIKQAAR